MTSVGTHACSTGYVRTTKNLQQSRCWPTCQTQRSSCKPESTSQKMASEFSIPGISLRRQAACGLLLVSASCTEQSVAAVGIHCGWLFCAALEKIGASTQALVWVEKAVDIDQTQGGSPVTWHRSLAFRCRGRILAASGQMDKAQSAFEAAISCISQKQYWMLEACAVHDLNEHVLRPSGQLCNGAEHRLPALLRKLTGPTELLHTLLEQQPKPK
jgi:hypothetical protein